jgi:transcription termination/antitermination protein NusG
MAMRWYSVSVLSNFEKKVAEAIREAVRVQGLEDEISDVLVPTEDVIEIRRGKKVQTEKRFMPGYVLVRMEMTDRAYHLINSINRVTGFLGPQGKPTPMRDDEVGRILNQVEEGAERPRSIINFETGETVNVTDGPFEGFSGMVEEVDPDNNRLKVSVSIFGRATPVELEFTQVAKASGRARGGRGRPTPRTGPRHDEPAGTRPRGVERRRPGWPRRWRAS